MTTLEPPFTSASNLASTMQAQGFAVLDAQTVQAWAGATAAQLSALVPSWDRLAADQYLKNNDRDDVSALVLVGGWVESLYLTVSDAAALKDAAMVNRIGEQKNTLNALIQLL